VGALVRRLPPGWTTVGTRVELEHRAATPIGGRVTVEARLAKADGRKLVFEIIARAGGQVVADGRVERMLVDRHRFLEKALEKALEQG
jgi:fluoroacetyl-CoA thioesterase